MHQQATMLFDECLHESENRPDVESPVRFPLITGIGIPFPNLWTKQVHVVN